MVDLIGDDAEMMRKFEIQFLQQAKASLEKITVLFNKNKIAEIKEEAHFLKTSAKAVGAEQTADLLEALELIDLDKDKDKDKKQCKERIILINRSLKQVYGAIINES